MAKKKLFFITTIFPYPFFCGSQVRMFNIIKSLSREFDITLVSQVSSDKDLIYVDKFNEYCKDICVILAKNKKSSLHKYFYKIKYWLYFFFKNIPKDMFYANYCGLQKVAMQLLKTNRFDICFFEYWFWPELLDWAEGLKVVDTNDVQYQRYEQLGKGNKKQLENYSHQEISTLNKYDVIITVTEKDKQILGKKLDKNKILIVPTGVNTNYYIPLEKNLLSENIISFYGSMAGQTNIEALFYFYRDIFPLIKKEVRNAKLLIVGSNPPQEVLNLAKQNDDITVTGYVQDVRYYLRMSKVSVCPMLVGYGIRGRVLELMSMGIPVVVTKAAVDGMQLQEGHGILIRNTINDFAQAVIDILQNTSLAKEIGNLGRDFILANCSYESTYDHLTELLYSNCTVNSLS